MKTDQWLILLGAVAAGAAIIAAVTGIWLIVWAWFDRPHTGWNVHISRERWRKVYRDDGREDAERIEPSQRHKATVSIKPVGTSKAYDVQVWFTGCTVWEGHDDLYTPRMEAGSEPLTFEIMVPEADAGPAHLHVGWLQLRPRRRNGQRTDLRTLDGANWRWCWFSLRWSERRLVRTQGRWVVPKRRPVPDIPVPEGATGPRVERLRADGPPT